jgi:hypothetical protein
MDTNQPVPSLTDSQLELRLDQAWRVLALNQELIRSADLRAYLLSFMSTMLVTFVANNLDKILKHGPLQTTLLIVFFISAVLFFFFSLTTLTARTHIAASQAGSEKGFIFFGDIAARRDAASFVSECRVNNLHVIFDDLNRQTHYVATIAKRKYATYRLAWFAVLAEVGSFLVLEISIALIK